jgi:microcin C transport system substrate-binding protein
MMPFVNAVKRLGIDCPIKTIEVSQHTNRIGNRDFDATITSYPQTLIPRMSLRTYWGSRAATQKYSRNTAGISDPVVDHLIETILNAKNRPELIAATRALDRVLLWNFYIIPGYWPPGYRYAYWDKFVKPPVQARFRSGYYDTWWIDAGKDKKVEAYIRGQRQKNED